MKKVGTALYVHKSAINQLYDKLDSQGIERINNAIKIAQNQNFDYTVIKYGKGKVSLIQSFDFDTANEPTVGDSLCIGVDDSIKIIKSSGKIYHRKYMFVNEDYCGFDIEQAKQRAMLWESTILDIKSHLSRIGQRKYWNNLLDKYGIEY